LIPLQQPVGTLPKPYVDSKSVNYGADIHVDPRGNHVYVSNRGHDSISAFKINEKGEIKGQYYELLKWVPESIFKLLPASWHDSVTSNQIVFDQTFVPTEGSFPRQFTIDPSGSYLLVANQNSDSIVSMKIDPEKGVVLSTGAVTRVPSPVALCFVPLPATS